MEKKMQNKTNNYKFFQNKKCKYFPCHTMEDAEEKFNCLFCYCPLYCLGDDCGGNFSYNKNGIKDCSKCNLPHVKDVGYNHIQIKIKEVINKVKK